MSDKNLELEQLDALSAEEKALQEKKVDLSFYKPDTLSYKMILSTTVLELIFLIIMCSTMDLTYLIGLFILVNICFLLLLFTVALEVKVYTPRASIISFVFGGYSLARFMIIPFILGVTSNIVMLYIICGVMAALTIGTGMISTVKVLQQRKYRADGKINAIQVSK